MIEGEYPSAVVINSFIRYAVIGLIDSYINPGSPLSWPVRVQAVALLVFFDKLNV